ncbi:MAG: hypothetical protein WA863_00810, partial [Methyloceanibacter sp.]
MLVQLLSKAATVAMLSFVVSSMLAMGAGLTVSQISEPLRNVRLVVLALLANFVVMPLAALALARMLWLDEPFGVGLLLLGCAAGAPFLPKLAELAKGNLAFAVGAMVLLMVVTLGTGQRNIAAALVVASQSFSDPKVVVMVIVVAIVGLIVLMPLS